jgi:hypothetical protein
MPMCWLLHPIGRAVDLDYYMTLLRKNKSQRPNSLRNLHYLSSTRGATDPPTYQTKSLAPLRIRDILRVDAKCPARPAAAFSLGRLHIGDQYKRRGVNLRGPSNIWNRARLFDQPIEADTPLWLASSPPISFLK